MGGFTQAIKTFLTGDPLAGIKGIIEEFHLSPEDKAKLQLEVDQLAAQREQITAARDAALDEAAGQNIRAETQSSDAYVRRARASFAYIIEVCIAWDLLLLPTLQYFAGKPPEPIPIPSGLLYLFGAYMLGFAGFHSLDALMALPGMSKVDMPFFKASNDAGQIGSK